MGQPTTQRTRAHLLQLRETDQACCFVGISFALALMLAAWVYHGGPRGRIVDADRASRRTIQFQLDVNTADWPEWTVLPGIGEKLARRIVQSRAADGPFQSHDELLRVKGIGPRTLDRIRPYLLPILPPASSGGL